jgi:glycogen debranching enzyme
MELNRLPELYCGFQRRHGEGPTLYPVACNPQAWSSAAVFFLLQACLGLRVDIATDRLYFEDPRLPMTVDELKITNLKVGYTTLDILLVRQDNSVSVTVPRRTGKTEVIVIH